MKRVRLKHIKKFSYIPKATLGPFYFLVLKRGGGGGMEEEGGKGHLPRKKDKICKVTAMFLSLIHICIVCKYFLSIFVQ